MKTELLPCPFCGSQNIIEIPFSHQAENGTTCNICTVSKCQDCNAQGPNTAHKPDVVKVWNRRPLPAPQPGGGGEAEDTILKGGDAICAAPIATEIAPSPDTCAVQSIRSTSNAEESTSNPSLHPPTPPIALPVRAEAGTHGTSYTLDPERKNEGGGLMAAGILKDGELVAIASGAGEEGLARIVAKLSERKTIHEWLNGCGIPREEHGKPICLLRRLRIACDNIAALSRELEESREGRADFIKLLASTLGVETDRQDYIVMHIQNLRAELEEAKAGRDHLTELSVAAMTIAEEPRELWDIPNGPSCPMIEAVKKLRNESDALRAAPRSEGTTPRVVCLCGSSKYPQEHMRVMMEETLAGRIVIPMGLYGHADFPAGARAATNDGDEATEVKQMLDRLHWRKIDAADEILVVTVDGYFGSSTKREIEYAERNGKTVRYRDFKALAPRSETEGRDKERSIAMPPRFEQAWQFKADELGRENTLLRTVLIRLLNHYVSIANVRNRRVIIEEEAPVIAARAALAHEQEAGE